MQPKKQLFPYKNRGFTLAELLIALLILGQIAAFTIPKILSSQQYAKKKTVIRETVASLSELVYLYCINPVPSETFYNYFANRLNTVKQCPTSAQAQGCDVSDTEPGFLLHSGASISGYRDQYVTGDGTVLDWNGLAGPNIEGDDRIYLVVNASRATAWGVGPCRVAPDGSPGSVALFNSVFSN